MTTPPDDPRADEGLVEAMARAIADDVYSNFEPEQREADDHEIWLTAAEAALAAARSHGGM